jgi:hypothetical protein
MSDPSAEKRQPGTSIAHARDARDELRARLTTLQQQLDQIRWEIDQAIGDGVVGEFTFGKLRSLDDSIMNAHNEIDRAKFHLRTF